MNFKRQHPAVFLVFMLTFISVWCFGQKTGASSQSPDYKTTTCRSSFVKVKIEGENNAANIEKVVKNTFENLKDTRCGLKLNYRKTSIGGYHYSFTQTFSGIAVYQSEIKINTDKGNIIHSVFDNSYDTRNWNLNTANAGDNAVIAIAPLTGLPVVAQLSIIKHSLETLTLDGAVIFQRDMNCYFAAPDSLVSGKVFNPDPLTTAGHVYDTITYNNNNGADAPWLDAQEQIVSFRANFDGVKFTLQSPYVQVVSFDTFAPNVAPVTSTTPQFYFNRSQSGFIDVNAFYHISTHHNYIRSLGFDCSDSLMLIDTHESTADQSFFAPPNTISYGLGGVPDAEDADVIVHEYCHSVSYTAAPGSNVGGQRNALDEAFCDYNAAAYSKSLNTFMDQWVYNWDGHNEFWNGRVVNSTRVYPTDLDNSIYDNGEIWSSTLFSLNGDIGRETTDSLIIQAHYSYAQSMSMADAAILLIDADSLISGGAHYCPIYERLLEHGFVQQNDLCAAAGITESKTDAVQFIQNGNSFTLFTNDNSYIRLQILDITGRQLATVPDEFRSVYNYQNQGLPSGIYLVNVLTENGVSTFKWVKAK